MFGMSARIAAFQDLDGALISSSGIQKSCASRNFLQRSKHTTEASLLLTWLLARQWPWSPFRSAWPIAIASGADPAAGLVTAIVAGFMISALGGSRVQIGGPTGAFIVVVFGTIAEHGYDGLVIATFMAGFILLVVGYFRAGNLIAFVPEAVVNGFTIGIAIIIASSQLKDFLGLVVEKVPAAFLEKVPVL